MKPTSLLSVLIYFAISANAAEPLDIGSRRQLFVDGSLIAQMKGVRQVLHHPVKRAVAIAAEHPWEKHGVSYMVTFRDGDKFRAWYRVDGKALSDRRSMTAYAESTDSIRWIKPKLGLIEYDGSKANNLVWNGPVVNLAVFKDGNPAAPADERYKAVARNGDLYPLASPDGLRWRLLQKKPILTERPFDSHNIAFWDAPTQRYVAYTRGVRKDGKVGRGMAGRFKGGGVRWVRRSTSRDFRNWTKLELINTGGAPAEEFYTNATIRYERAPDWLLMFPSRFASAREPKPGWKHGQGVNDIALLTSRDGLHWNRQFMAAFIRPGLDEGNWHERSLYLERGILQTSPTELSLYGMQNWRLPSVHIRRYTLRPDGFVSVQADYRGGEMVTEPFRFTGSELRLNFSTSAVGLVRVEIQSAKGKPIAGFRLEDCPEIYGDKIDGLVKWKTGADVSRLVGKTVRLRFELKDADLYAFRFAK